MVVVDASVVYKWLIFEDPETAKAAEAILENFRSNKIDIIVPDILLYEIGNTLAFKSRLKEPDIRRAWKQLANYNLSMFTPTFDFIEKSIAFSKKHEVSVYDASYTVLAQENKCDLITADNKFAKQVNLPFVKTLGS